MAPNSLGSFRAALRDHERADASASSVQPPAERKRSRDATQPVCSVLFAALLLGESPSRLQLLGAACIVAGLVVASLRSQRIPAPEPELAG